MSTPIRRGNPKRRRRSTRNRPTDEQLLDAALQVVVEVGAERATMDAIAERADTTKVTLYAHYGSREALIGALMDRELDLITRWMFESYDKHETRSPRERTRAAVEALFDYAVERPGGFQVLLNTTHGNVRGTGNGASAEADPGRRLFSALEPRIAQRFRSYYEGLGQERRTSADILAAMVLSLSMDIAHQAIASGVPPIAAKDLAVTATLGALRAITAEQLDAIDNAAG